MKWKNIKRIAFGLVIFLSLLLIWGVVIEPRLVDYKEETAVIPNLPAAWEGRRVALIADLQVGMWFGNEGTTAKIVNRIIEERPAAVLIAGDFVYKPIEDEREDVEREEVLGFMEEVNEAVALVRPLTNAGIPTYAVLGNHDYGMSHPGSRKNQRLADAVRQTLEAAGVRVIDNAVVPLTLTKSNGLNDSPADPGSALYFAGVGSRYAGNAHAEIALAHVPNNAPRIVFMHEPDSFGDLPANAAPLAVAGHTHGGQIRIPFTEDWTWMSLATGDEVQADGWIDDFGQAGNRLYVNRGVGFSGFPIRINCVPELTIFTLRSGYR